MSIAGYNVKEFPTDSCHCHDRQAEGAGCIVLFIIVFLVSLVALDFITKKLRLIDWHTSFEAMSALGAVLIPLAVVYIETKVERTRTKIESENAHAIEKMQEILKKNEEILSSIKEYEDKYREDIEALSKLRKSGTPLMTGKVNGTTASFDRVSL